MTHNGVWFKPMIYGSHAKRPRVRGGSTHMSFSNTFEFESPPPLQAATVDGLIIVVVE